MVCKMVELRDKIPTRSKVQPKNNYRDYRSNLVSDFNHRCGYCDHCDEFDTDSRFTFHIDHFAPKSRFPMLENEYENLVYACFSCNIGKSNHWIGDNSKVSHNGKEGFVDPCCREYDNHLGRTELGCITPKTTIGEYMHKKLKFYLMRHQFLWSARQAKKQKDETKLEISEFQRKRNDDSEKLLKLYKQLDEHDENLSWYLGLVRNCSK